MMRMKSRRKATRAPKLFVGVGNVLLHDDGVGVRVAEMMAALGLPGEVDVYDAGSGGIEMGGLLEGRDLVVVVGAMQADAEPGTIYRLGAADLRPCSRSGMSVHDLHLLNALDELDLHGTAPKEVVVFTVQVADVSVGLGLSCPVQGALREVVLRAAFELGLPAPELPATWPASVWSPLSATCCADNGE